MRFTALRANFTNFDQIARSRRKGGLSTGLTGFGASRKPRTTPRLCYNFPMRIRHLEQLKDVAHFKDQTIPCIVREMLAAPSNDLVAMHGHEFSELVVVVAGSLNHIHAGRTVRLRKGDFFAIHPGERHGYAELARGTVVLNILYHHDKPPSAIAATPFPLMDALFPRDLGAVRADVLGRIPRTDLADVRSLAKAIRHENRAERPLRDAVCASLFSTLLLLLARAAAPSLPSASPIQKELDFIARNIGEKITVKDLCAVSERAERTLFREFQKATGRTPCDYILALRAAKAEALLKRGGMTRKKAAALTGFCNASHLSRTLRAQGRG